MAIVMATLNKENEDYKSTRHKNLKKNLKSSERCLRSPSQVGVVHAVLSKILKSIP